MIRQSPADVNKPIGAAALLALVIVLSVRLDAQSTATLRGRVVDATGAVVPGAAVSLRSAAIGVDRAIRTDGVGAYQIAGLPAGEYRLEVQVAGFETQVVERLSLEVAAVVVQDFRLTVGEIAEQVIVTSPSPLIERATVSVGTVLDQRTVQEIPLNGRHFVDLGLLVPGSVTPPQNGFLTAPTRAFGGLALNTAGGREDTVNFQVNGVTLNDQVNNILVFQPTIDAVREFRIDNSTFSAEYGRNSGAVANIATRSGSNEFHGALFDFLRDDALDAPNFFASASAPAAELSRNQFGGNAGGPLWKDRTFFFVAYEGLRQQQGLDVNSVVLSDAQRASVRDPVVQRIAGLLPAANQIDASGVARFIGSVPAPVDVDQWTADVNQNLGAASRVHAFYAIQRDLRPEPLLQGNTVPGFGDLRDAWRQILTLNSTRASGPRFMNEARFGFNRIVFDATAGAPLNPTAFGIANGIDAPVGLPQINVAGAFNLGGPVQLPQGRTDTSFVFSDAASYFQGRHSLKGGAEFRQFYNNSRVLDSGTFNFPTVDSFIAGTANSFSIVLGDRSNHIAQGALGLFVQDSFRWRPTLTLDVGLRYDWFMTPTERDDRFIVFDAPTASLLRIGVDRDEVFPQNNRNIQPRAGITWDPTGSGRTSVRGAYGIYTEQPMTNLVGNLSANPPLATPLTVTGAVRLDNAITLARAGGLAPITVDPGYRNGLTHAWNVNIQREIVADLAVMAGYFGSTGTRLRLARNINQPVNGQRPFTAVSLSSPILPGATLGNITQVEGSGSSTYNALWLSANRRLAAGLQFGGSYTWSKSLDYNSLSSPPTAITVQDSYDAADSRGLSDFDARHRFVLNGIYQLPFRGTWLVEGWQLAAIVQAQTGNPVNLVTSNSTVNGVANTVRPDLVGPIAITGTVDQWFDTSAFVAVNRFGTLGRNVVTGPRFDNTDFSIMKNTRIGRRSRAQFRVEIFNLLNHANLGQPGRIVGSPNFGRITNTRFATGDSGSSRQIQLAVRFEY